MAESAPTVSILLPARNVARTIDLAVASIVAQTVADWELLLLEDGSADDTVALLRSWAARDDRIRVHTDGRSLGISDRLNQGVRLARGAYVARMDGDDVSLPDRLEVQLDLLRRHPEVDLVGAGEIVFSSAGELRGYRSGPVDHAEIVQDPLHGIPVSHPTWLGRRDWFLRHPYDTTADACEDQELLLRASSVSTYANVPRIVLAYREDRIKLGRSLAARRASARYLLRHGRSTPMRATAAAGGQLLRGARDALAVLTGQQERVLRGRVDAPRPTDVELWDLVRPSVVPGGQRESP